MSGNGTPQSDDKRTPQSQSGSSGPEGSSTSSKTGGLSGATDSIATGSTGGNSSLESTLPKSTNLITMNDPNLKDAINLLKMSEKLDTEKQKTNTGNSNFLNRIRNSPSEFLYPTLIALPIACALIIVFATSMSKLCKIGVIVLLLLSLIFHFIHVKNKDFLPRLFSQKT